MNHGIMPVRWKSILERGGLEPIGTFVSIDEEFTNHEARRVNAGLSSQDRTLCVDAPTHAFDSAGIPCAGVRFGRLWQQASR